MSTHTTLRRLEMLEPARPIIAPASFKRNEIKQIMRKKLLLKHKKVAKRLYSPCWRRGIEPPY